MASDKIDFGPFMDSFSKLYREEYKMNDDWTPRQYEFDGGSVNMYNDAGGYSQDYISQIEKEGGSVIYRGNVREGAFKQERDALFEEHLPFDISTNVSLQSVVAHHLNKPFYDKVSGEQVDPSGLFHWYLDEAEKIGVFSKDPMVRGKSGFDNHKLQKNLSAFLGAKYTNTKPVESKLIDEMQRVGGE